MESIAIPSTLKVMREYNFEKCRNLKRIEFLEGRRTLGEDSGVWNEIFRNCGVEEVTLPGTLQEMSPDIFKGCGALGIVRVGKDCPVDVESMVDSNVEVRRE